ncbi:oxidoreductase [Dictyobacter aurantiacus]|uniref:Short-chain dehydrogenase/reductase n=1 Tax=Dictyobacter aurantiacus TaxID=1936993 RepID=A0A401ZJU1_9CHLR|nr:oxidoreductase [Dictyobacter aurantiacus]GCE07123.1 short-chain dehydrogenase/reductase [Dictyobacter aurantiacus]
MSKIWMITGSSRGFGRSLAEAVLAQGDSLLATARRPEQLTDLVERYPGRIRTMALDVTNAEQARAAVETAVESFGRLDVVVNNAGYANVASIEEASEEDWRTQIETNLWGVIHVTRAALPVLRKQRSGHIVQFSSVGGRTGVPGLGAYQVAKWGVEGFSETLMREVAPLGIKVTIIEPGGFRTDWAGSSMNISEPGPDYQQTIGQMVEYRRVRAGQEPGDPARAAQAIIAAINEPEPPFRLLLGKDAVHLVRQIEQANLAEIERWEHLSSSTDFVAGAVNHENDESYKTMLDQLAR